MVKSLPINKSELFESFFTKSSSRKIKYLVLHHIADKNIQSAIKELKKHKVSSHYLIDEDGNIFQLVSEQNIAYHAGISFWNGEFNLNKSSIGIEFFSTDPYQSGFNEKQIESGIKLCQNIIKTHKILQKNIVGHGDIAYNKESGFLNRKDDPSHLFPWKYFAKNGIGIWPKKDTKLNNNKILFKLGDQNKEIAQIKKDLSNFGYKIDNLNNDFDEEFRNITIAFNRRFNPDNYLLNKDRWASSSSNILKSIL